MTWDQRQTLNMTDMGGWVQQESHESQLQASRRRY